LPNSIVEAVLVIEVVMDVVTDPETEVGWVEDAVDDTVDVRGSVDPVVEADVVTVVKSQSLYKPC
jgi:hypothetical protein